MIINFKLIVHQLLLMIILMAPFSSSEDQYYDYDEEVEVLEDDDYPLSQTQTKDEYFDDDYFLEQGQRWKTARLGDRLYNLTGVHSDDWLEIEENARRKEAEEKARELGEITEEVLITTTEEPYQSAIERLSCDNPWFWNSFKCLYLDVRRRNYIERTRSNAITVAYFVGPPAVVLLFFILSFIITTLIMRARVRAFERKMEEVREKYEPGSIELDDGTIRKYKPTNEEIDAFENMISALVSIV